MRKSVPQIVFRRWCFVVLACFVFTSAAVQLQKPKAAATSAATQQIRFENRQKQSGVRFVLENSTTDNKPIIDSVLGGVALLDFDNDGYLDIFFTNGAQVPGLSKEPESFHNRLYRNNHDGTFSDVTARAGVAGAGYSMGAAAADFDNDEFTDLYVTGFDRNILYHNNGDGTFTDVTEHAGVSGRDAAGKKLWSVGAAWVDFDNDGRLDLFVANYLDWSFANTRVCGEPGRRLSCTSAYFQGQPNFLYHNNGDGTFTETSAATGIAQHIGKGMSVTVADYDDDGFMDIFVANDNERNFLFHNQHGRAFVEVGVEAAVAFTEDGIPVSSMGADFRDLNNDGRPDVIVTALEGETFPLYINQGGGFFMPWTYPSGIGFASHRMSGWGVGAYDFNNDGLKDLFIANSHVSENVGLYGNHQYRKPNAVFANMGKGTFRNVSAQAGAAMNVPAAHRGSAFGDLNNDGRVDAVVSVIGSPAEILYNTSPGAGHWILIQTEGKQSNRDGIGTKIKLTGESGLVQYNHVTTATGYASSSDKRVHFGLGGDKRIREIELRWPSGKVQVLQDIAADQILKVAEP
jgi:hypothetical protein